MALLKSKESKEEKKERREQEILQKYGLENVSDPAVAESLNRISTEMMGTGLMNAGMKLSLTAKTEDQLQVQYQRVLVEQNFIIIRQLDRIAKLLDR